MFRRLHTDSTATVTISVDGAPIAVRRGDSVAAALLLAGRSAGRTTPVTGAARGPYCMMGVCFDCLVEIDGVGNRQACMIEVEEGMQVQSQRGARRIDPLS